MTSSAWGVKEVFPVDGEFLIMRPLVCKTIPDNVPAIQNGSGLPVAVDLFQPVPSINSSALKNLSFSDITRLDAFFDHTGRGVLRL